MPPNPKAILAWHFLPEDRCLRYDDGRKVFDGRTYSIPKGESPILCECGMHASIKARDALQYAPGPIICRVELSGDVILGDDKCVARSRKVLWMADATNALWEHALWCAEQALPIWRKYYPDDNRPQRAIEVKRLHLAGKATDAELFAARDAALYAAWAAAGYAARDAALYAAGDAALYAAGAAALYAARAAAGAAALYAAWDAQEADLSRRLMALAPKAKRSRK